MLTIKNISCNHQGTAIIRNLSFQIKSGELACLLGMSGCGKTTILRAIAGFHNIECGTINLAGTCIASQKKYIPTEQRNIGMVFQDNALFPHLNVEKNIEAGLYNTPNKKRKEIVKNMLASTRLEGLENRFPQELSGGQQQRVALARALAPAPQLILMDEPFSNLDSELRIQLAEEVRLILKENNMTCLMVTHDQQDAFTFGDKVGFIHDGDLLQWDTPYNLYHMPSYQRVAEFIGDGVFLDGIITGKNSVKTALADIAGTADLKQPIGKKVKLLVRPDDILHDDNSTLVATIKKKIFRGESYLYTLILSDGSEIMSLVPSHHNHSIGENLGIVLEIDHLICFTDTKPINNEDHTLS